MSSKLHYFDSDEPVITGADGHTCTDSEFSDPKLKDTNPKDAIGSDKIPFHLWPETASALGALGMLDGALKYGRSNFRPAGVRASVYYDACRRHLNKWFECEEQDPDSGLPHLAHALACIAIVIDAQAAGALIDDRMYKGGYAEWIDKLTPHVKRLKEKHKDKSPKHWTQKDNIKPGQAITVGDKYFNYRNAIYDNVNKF